MEDWWLLKHTAAAGVLAWVVALPDSYKALAVLMLLDMAAAFAAAIHRADGSLSKQRCWNGVMKKVAIVLVLMSLATATRWMGFGALFPNGIALLFAGHELLSVVTNSAWALPPSLAAALHARISPTVEEQHAEAFPPAKGE